MDGIIGFATGNVLPDIINNDTTKQPETVSADRPYTFSKVLGRSIPIVIGTGKVDGVPVIGGAVTTQTITGYNSVPNPDSGSGIIGFPTGGAYLPDIGAAGPVQVPIYSTQQTTRLGYLLAFDPFGDGYQLVRLEINDAVVYDAEKGIGASAPFRFYGGNHTAVDPITVTNIGANAGAWKRFAMVYIDGFVASSAPTVKAVISNAATAGGGTHQIAWTGTVPTTYSENSAGRQAAYDPTQDVIYQLLGSVELPGTPQVYLAVLDAVTYAERYRVPLQGSEGYVADSMWIYAIRGSNFVFVRFADVSLPDLDIVYNVTTGAIVSSHSESGEIFDWKIGFPFGTSYIITGFDFGAGLGLPYAEIDILGNVSIGRVTGSTGGDLVYGRTTAGTVSFFACSSGGTVQESVFNGDAWTTTTVYTSAGVPSGAWYDPRTGYLIVLETVSSVSYIRYVNPDTGAIIDSINTATHTYFITTGTLSTGHERYWPRPGYVMMTDGTGAAGKVYLLDIGSKTITTYAQDSGITNLEFTTGIFDQNKQVYFQAFGTTHWTEHQLPNILPGLVSLSSFILTKLWFLAGYGPTELTFEGFVGVNAYGFVIATDTNVRTAGQAVADFYGFSFADTGNGFYFKKPGRDTSFAVDLALTTDDLVFGTDAAVKSTDQATIRSTMRVELDYVSRDQAYTSRPASFQMPAINNSIKTDKFSSPLTLSDADAQKFVTDKFFELQGRRRSHAFSLTGQVTLLPGDIVTVPSGLITYTVQVNTLDLNRDTMAMDVTASDFQTSVSTTVTAVTNTGFGNIIAVTLATQYIHLDIPLFRYADDLGGTGLRQYGIVASRGQTGWGGGTLYRGDTVANLTALLSQAPQNGVLGICETVLGNPVDPFALTDTSTVTFRRTVGSSAFLVNATEAQVLAGANLAFIGAQGRWEGVGYKTVVDNGNGTFTLSGFSIRGYRGTEVFAYSHQKGDQFVMIDASWLKGVSHPLSDLNSSKFYKAIGLTQDPATGTIVQHTMIGAAETPYASRNLTAAIETDGILLGWDYRSRLADGLNPANFGETALAFQIDILAPVTDGFSVVRTLTSTTNSKLYINADIISDFGGAPAALTFDVYMMSAVPVLVPGQTPAVAGRGYRARRHVVFSPGTMTADNSIITADSTAYKADAA